MSSPSLTFQKALRDRLVGDVGVTNLVPSANIFDAHGLPSVFPSIIIGEAQEISSNLTFDDMSIDVFHTLHIWTREPGLVDVKRIGGAVRRAIGKSRFFLPTVDEFQACDVGFDGVRYVRDSDGETGHGILTVRAMMQELVTI